MNSRLSNRLKNKIVALLLCMVMVLSNSLSVAYGSEVEMLAGGSQEIQEVATEIAEQGEVKTENIEPETQETSIQSLTEGTVETETTPTVTEQVAETVESAGDTVVDAETNVVDDTIENIIPKDEEEIVEESTSNNTEVVEKVEPVVDTTAGTTTDIVEDVVENVRTETEAETSDDEVVETVEAAVESAIDTVTTMLDVIVGNEIVLKTEVNGTVIKMSGPIESFPVGTDYKISATELTVEQQTDVEVALRKMELESETKVVSYQAYDIKLIVDGKEVQPLGDVNVTFNGGTVEEKVDGAENVEVFHIDEVQQVAEVITNETKNNKVEMTTDHFSTYVITITTQGSVKVTVEHYVDSKPAKVLYRPKEYDLTIQSKLEEIAIANNYTVSRIVRREANNSETTLYQANNNSNDKTSIDEKVLSGDTTYRVYYTATTDTTKGVVQMFDYQVNTKKTTVVQKDQWGNTITDRFGNPKTEEVVQIGDDSINHPSNYPNGVGEDQRLGSGGHLTSIGDKYTAQIGINGKGYEINKYHSSSPTVMSGIITGVNYKTGELIMGKNTAGEQLYEPGFFSTSPKEGKQILEGYELEFSRNGDTYTLTHVLKNNQIVERGVVGTFTKDTTKVFFPLDGINSPTENSSDDKNHNYYFGLRYDIAFTIGDYLGELTYQFNGDDDLWVVLDAKDGGGQVVIDLGGIHQPEPGSVNLWSILDPNGTLRNKIANNQELTKAEQEILNKEHTLTVLYMERGAGDSTCAMQFTLPNSKIIDPTINEVNFKLNVEKTVSGLTATEFEALKEKLTFVVTATNLDETPTTENAPFEGRVINARNMTWTGPDANGRYKGTYTLNAIHNFIDQYKYTITESNEVIDKYDVSTAVKADSIEVAGVKSATIAFTNQTEKTVAFTNIYTPSTKNIEITKVWKDAGNAYNTRPTEISFKLQWKYVEEGEWADYDSNDQDVVVDVYTMQEATHVDSENPNHWKYTVSGLPIVKDSKDVEYRVVEIVGEKSNVDKYYVSTTENATTMVNKFDVEIVKISSSQDGYLTKVHLGGAVFTAKKQDGTTYYGESESDGLIVWYTDSGLSNEISILPDGSYTLEEFQAPAGYELSTEIWNVNVIDGVLAVPQDEFDLNNLTTIYDENNNVVRKIYSVYFENTPLYELPSTGSFGIYVPMISGMLLMMAAALILFKNKYGEVL